MKKLILLLLFLPLISYAQTYKYIGIEDGLSNRRISNIQKDSRGYMWFLTSEGMDRYNGKEIKHYNLQDGSRDFASQIHLGWVYAGENEGLWVIGQRGRIFRYDTSHDQFKMIYKLPDSYGYVTCCFQDRKENLWLCTRDSIILYNNSNGTKRLISNVMDNNITVIEQVDSVHFFVAGERGIRYTELTKDSTLRVIPIETLCDINSQVNELYYHQETQRLFIGTFEEGVIAYELTTHQIIRPKVDLSDVSVTRITPLNETELLVATEGMGIHKVNVNTCVIEPYLMANYESNNEMNGNNASDIYIDEQKRIWVANYPEGVTVVDNRYKNYRWMRHSIGNSQSLINNQVHAVLEDEDGDLWFATSNGISLYNSATGRWHSFLDSFDHHLEDKNHIFTALCEVSPGIIWASGYTSGIYMINKRNLSVEYFSPFLLASVNIRPDKYIRGLIKDSKGCVWSGGYYNLKCYDPKDNSLRLYPGVSSITVIAEKDENYMWIGTSTGLYLLDRNSGELQYLVTPVGVNYINALYQSPSGLLYIGTGGSGMLIYDSRNKTFENYYTDNCALISNNIYTILPEVEGRIIMSTEDGITCFNVKEKTFRNWTKEQGLMSACFNPISGTLRKKGGFVLGSTDGAVEFPENLNLPGYTYSRMILSDFQVSYQTVHPGDENSPLKQDINDTKVLKLAYDQNTFSLTVFSINYDFPSNVLYSWKLEGFYDEWIKPSTTNLIRFTNLDPGRYVLRIRAVSKEEQTLVFEERRLEIIIARPWWLSGWAIMGYIVLAMLVLLTAYRILSLRKEKKVSDEKTRFFINTAHDLRTPLTLIKAPLEELFEKESLSERGRKRMEAALRNVDALMRLTGNLINFERTDVYSSELFIAEYDLDAYLHEVYEVFHSYASFKHIDFTCQNEAKLLKVWFDREKMDSILKNILSNAMKYTPEYGKVGIRVWETKDSWGVEVQDTGIGVSAQEHSKLFKRHFRATNAINSKVTGSGIGLMLTRKLVHLHGGKISFESVVRQGTTVRIVFPKGKEHFRKYTLVSPNQETMDKPVGLDVPLLKAEKQQEPGNVSMQRILVVEDNDELRNYLSEVFSDTYYVQACCNGKEALVITKEFWPELILSDIMMPEMRGDELCAAIKSDIETSHIPVLLLTALGDEKNILEGLKIGADDYITKPFNVNILRASIANLLTNRALLRKKYVAMEMDDTTTDAGGELPANCTNALDWKFISAVHKSVEDNMDNPDFTVDTLCGLHNMSRSSFYNKLKALTGQSPADYIRLIRLKRATVLLREGNHSIAEVAEMTGFCDSKYFREVFKKHFNVSPSKYGKEE